MRDDAKVAEEERMICVEDVMARERSRERKERERRERGERETKKCVDGVDPFVVEMCSHRVIPSRQVNEIGALYMRKQDAGHGKGKELLPRRRGEKAAT